MQPPEEIRNIDTCGAYLAKLPKSGNSDMSDVSRWVGKIVVMARQKAEGRREEGFE